MMNYELLINKFEGCKDAHPEIGLIVDQYKVDKKIVEQSHKDDEIALELMKEYIASEACKRLMEVVL